MDRMGLLQSELQKQRIKTERRSSRSRCHRSINPVSTPHALLLTCRFFFGCLRFGADKSFAFHTTGFTNRSLLSADVVSPLTLRFTYRRLISTSPSQLDSTHSTTFDLKGDGKSQHIRLPYRGRDATTCICAIQAIVP